MVKKYTIIAGHGKTPKGWDPGASGQGYTEAGFIRDLLIPAMKKYSASNVEFVTDHDVYSHKTLTRYKGSIVTELHLDAFTSDATGGHVIVYKGYSPDNIDLKLRDTIKKWFGIRYNHKGHQGISGRDDLQNVNISHSQDINYRLVELGFITNDKNMRTFLGNVDTIARELVIAITGTAKPISSVQYYNVIKGDTLSHIAQKYNTTVKKLQQLNGITNPDIISIGERLRIR